MKISRRHPIGNRVIYDAQKVVEHYKKPVESQESTLHHIFHITQVSIWIKVLIPLIGLTLIVGLPVAYHKIYPNKGQNQDKDTISPEEMTESLTPSKAVRSAYRKTFDRKKHSKANIKIDRVDIVSDTPNQDEIKLSDPIEKAVELYESGQLKEAAAYLKDLLNQGRVEARLPLARLLRELNSPDCIQYYIEEAEAADGDESMLYEAGMAMLDFDTPRLAHGYAERLIADNSQSFAGLVLMAHVAEYQKDWEGAAEYLKKALTLRPDSLEEHWQLAWIYAQQVEIEASLSEYSVAASLAQTPEESKQIEKSIEALKKALAQIEGQESQQEPDEEKPVEEQAESGVTVIPLKPIGKHFFVPLVLNNTLETELMIDTGASITAISPVIAEQLGLTALEPEGYIKLNTAGGNVEAPYYILPNMQFGGYILENFRIAVLGSFAQTNMTGILGMDLLRYFHFSFDMDNQVLILEMKSTGQSD